MCGMKNCMALLDIKGEDNALEEEEELHLLSAEVVAFSKLHTSI